MEAVCGPLRAFGHQEVGQALSLVPAQALFSNGEMGKLQIRLVGHAPFPTVIHQFYSAAVHEIAIGQSMPGRVLVASGFHVCGSFSTGEDVDAYDAFLLCCIRWLWMCVC